MEIENSTQQRILEVATNVFYQKGLAGARMQEIADQSGINKAMLHYYYRTKEQLFEKVFQRTFFMYIGSVSRLLNSQSPLKEKLWHFVDEVMDMLQKYPHIPVFILHELNQNPNRITELFTADEVINFEDFKKEVTREVRKGNIKKVKAEQLFTDLIALTVLPFVAQPLLCKVLGKNQEQFVQFLQERKKELKTNWLEKL
jgi:AcrR family transcriptional regulator